MPKRKRRKKIEKKNNHDDQSHGKEVDALLEDLVVSHVAH